MVMKSHFILCRSVKSCRFISHIQQDPNRAQKDYNPRLMWFIEFFLPIIFAALSSILIVHNNMAFTPGHGFFLPIYYVACIAGWSFEHFLMHNFFTFLDRFRIIYLQYQRRTCPGSFSWERINFIKLSCRQSVAVSLF